MIISSDPAFDENTLFSAPEEPEGRVPAKKRGRPAGKVKGHTSDDVEATPLREGPPRRALSSWIASYRQVTEGTESPDSFHLWSALWAVSAALGRKVWLEMGHFAVYPSVYIILTAPPGGARKGSALRVAKKLVQALDLPTSPDYTTMENMVEEVWEAKQSFEIGEDTYIHHSYAICSAEFATLFMRETKDSFTLLTDWYDCADPFRYHTKTSGKYRIDGIYCTMLAASTPQSLGKTIPDVAIGGGFTSRVLFVVESGKPRWVSNPTLTDEQLRTLKLLAQDLLYIHTHFKGKFTMNAEAIAAYDKWYMSQPETRKTSDPRLLSYLERKGDYVWKVAMLYHVTMKDDQILDAQDINAAITLLDDIEPRMTGAFAGVGNNKNAVVQAAIVEHLKRAGKPVPMDELLRIFQGDADHKIMADVLRTLLKMGEIIHMDVGGKLMFQAV